MTKPYLDYLLGNFKDKYDIALSIQEPELSLLVKDLINYEPQFVDLEINKQFPVAKIWLALISNPNLTEECFDLLYPKLFHPSIYSITLSLDDQQKAIDNILNCKFITLDKLKTVINYIWTVFPSSARASFAQNFLRRLGTVSKSLGEEPLYEFFFLKQKQLIENASGNQLLGLKTSAHKLKSFLNNNLIYINPHLDLVKAELKKRKHSVPAQWKNYSGANFEVLINDLENKIYKLKNNRKDFLRQLKNRVLSPEQITQESLIYLNLLEELSQIIQDQKADIHSKISTTELKAPESQK